MLGALIHKFLQSFFLSKLLKCKWFIHLSGPDDDGALTVTGVRCQSIIRNCLCPVAPPCSSQCIWYRAVGVGELFTWQKIELLTKKLHVKSYSEFWSTLYNTLYWNTRNEDVLLFVLRDDKCVMIVVKQVCS